MYTLTTIALCGFRRPTRRFPPFSSPHNSHYSIVCVTNERLRIKIAGDGQKDEEDAEMTDDGRFRGGQLTHQVVEMSSESRANWSIVPG
ncbi:hypothetical protein J6590_050163 [Homalodisca vitripennis]|nr:hypothetical protein J6590_050163 [Homalodisca vitripennis]